MPRIRNQRRSHYARNSDFQSGNVHCQHGISSVQFFYVSIHILFLMIKFAEINNSNSVVSFPVVGILHFYQWQRGSIENILWLYFSQPYRHF